MPLDTTTCKSLVCAIPSTIDPDSLPRSQSYHCVWYMSTTKTNISEHLNANRGLKESRMFSACCSSYAPLRYLHPPLSITLCIN